MILKEQLETLQTLTEEEVKLKEQIKKKKEEFEVSISDLTIAYKDNQAKIEATKNELSVEAKKEFEETGNKKLLGGIGIRETNRLNYNVERVRDWCLEKKMFLNVNLKEFDKVAKSLNLDFVKEEKEITVTFPSVIKLED